MKIRNLVLTAGIIFSSVFCWAETPANTNVTSDQATVTQVQPLTAPGFDAQMDRRRSRRDNNIVRRLIGGIADAILRNDNYAWDRSYDGRYPYDGGRDNSNIACYAEGFNGQLYRGISGSSSRKAQSRANESCYQNSFQCRPLGCEYM